MRFLIIFMLLFVGAAHAQDVRPPSEWSDKKAGARCAYDLRQTYGTVLTAVSLMGRQPHESNTYLVGIIASDNRPEFKGQQVVVGCLYKQNGSPLTVFFNTKIANWTEPTRAAAPAKRPSPPSSYAEEYDGNVTTK